MRLKNIEMQGFKSFADKIYLDFNPGITAIVGPNGAGKSNISDAIRWVMGEQSIKSLRGSKMEDVIFAGTEARKALGFAEVTLTLDNSDHYFSLDFPEITVTRRVYRSGEGEYYINKTLCRLKDIHELFMDTGLGRDGYSIIGQGKIDNILSTKSEDRRQIFEEAAGISKYKYRKIEAERKLLQTTDNLTRVQDILTELEGQLGPLERQSEKARRYLVLRDEMRGLDIAVSVINAEKAKKELVELTQNIQLLDGQIAEIKKELDETDVEISAMYDQSKEYDEKMEACREADKSTVESINDDRNQVNLLVNDVAHSEQDILRLEEEIETGKIEIQKIDGLLEEHGKLLDSLKIRGQGASQTLEELTQESQKASQVAGEKNQLLESIRMEMIELAAKENASMAGIDNLKILAESFSERQVVIEKELSGRSQDNAELLATYEKNQQNYQEAIEKLEQLKTEVAGFEEELHIVAKEQQELINARNQQQLILSQKQSRQSMLQDMEREYEGYAKGVKGVMTAYQKGEISNAKIYGPLAQLIKTDQKYIVAIETALGAVNQNIVTEKEEDAKAAIGYLKKHHLGRATFLPVRAIRPKKFQEQPQKGTPGFIAVAADLISCDERYKDIISSFLGTTVICDNLDNAIAMAKKAEHKFKIVTLDGDVIQAGGAMTGGSTLKTTGSLSRTGEIEKLDRDIASLEKDLEKQKNTQQMLLASEENLREKLQNAQDIMQKSQAESIKLDAELQHQKELLETFHAGFEKLQRELDGILVRLGEIDKEIEEKKEDIQTGKARYLELEENLKNLQIEYNELSVKNDKLLSQLTELNIDRNSVLKEMELQNDRISRLNTEKSQNVIAITAKSERIQEIRKQIDAMQEEMAQLTKGAKEKEEALSQYQADLERLAKEKGELEVSLRAKQASIKDVQEQVFQLTQQQTKMESRAERYELEIEGIVERLLEEYELPYSEAAEMKPAEDFDYKDASQKIKSLRDQIRALGNINIDAIEEYKNVKERFDFLTVQTTDLGEAKKELESVIEEMLQIMQIRFAEQFAVINQNFNRVFVSLFGGGRASLTLTDPDNVLESGIEIEAQPPGKKLQNLSLLSGGEKAFTAIALLFSILEVRPTPFCILDEIEAALDDVNVYRFADYLKHYSDKTQFIVVTHRRGTMEMANILYGVTMQERGISKLLSLNIDEIQQ